jgi:hypothetical protein
VSHESLAARSWAARNLGRQPEDMELIAPAPPPAPEEALVDAIAFAGIALSARGRRLRAVAVCADDYGRVVAWLEKSPGDEWGAQARAARRFALWTPAGKVEVVEGDAPAGAARVLDGGDEE